MIRESHTMPLRSQQAVGHGILIVRKPVGWTSHDVVAKLRTCLPGVRIGHGGTLDPAATGVLPILLGKATRISEYALEWDKEYVAVLRLGQETDTQDATGVIIREMPVRALNEETLAEAIAKFRGSVQQVPPMYSAVKVQGERLYRAARAGREVERKPRWVTITQLDVVAIQGQDITLRIHCSKGTYVRTLCADIGAAMGVGGHLASLERTRVGPLGLEHALAITDIVERGWAVANSPAFWTLAQVLAHLPTVLVGDEMLSRIRNGAPVPASQVSWQGNHSNLEEGTVVKVTDRHNQVLAISQFSRSSAKELEAGHFIPKKVLMEEPAGALTEQVG